MTNRDRDSGLDTLLDLHGQTLFVDEAGHWVKFIAVRTEVTPQRPHGLSYSLTLHAPDEERLVGFDNAHPVRERRGREREGAAKAITDTGVDPLNRTNIGVRRRCSRTSGMKSTLF